MDTRFCCYQRQTAALVTIGTDSTIKLLWIPFALALGYFYFGKEYLNKLGFRKPDKTMLRLVFVGLADFEGGLSVFLLGIILTVIQHYSINIFNSTFINFLNNFALRGLGF